MADSATPQTNENIQRFLDALQNPSKPLTPWELGFLESITDQFDRSGHLSRAQFETLEKIYAEKTD